MKTRFSGEASTDRMLSDIGLRRCDAIRITNAHSFWKFMFQPESG